MKPVGYPPKQGLYDPQFEHDSCGMGFVVSIKGEKSNKIVRNAIQVLLNLDHRGACGCEANTGDGAGILVQKPHKFFKKICEDIGITLPSYEEYAVGAVFFPQDASERRVCAKTFERIIEEEGQEVLGWRDVPTDNSSLGDTAIKLEPYIKQVFIKRSPDITDQMGFERKLYIIKKRALNEIRLSGMKGGQFFYLASLSGKTTIYKGMLTTWQLNKYYPDLNDPDMESAIALVHSRFSTNTFPSWDRSHPYRYIVHNGEINTLRGNINWMHAREAVFSSEHFGEDLHKTFPIITPEGSDSGNFDNCVEFLYLAGRPIEHAVMMMIPEPWSNHETMSDEKKAFYEYHSCLMEPWDGPASIAFTDGSKVGAVLDRNGLRPSRYYVTKDDMVIMGSEVGVLDVPADMVLHKGRLQPGRMFLVDTVEGRIVDDKELKEKLSKELPYREWLDNNLVPLNDIESAPDNSDEKTFNHEKVLLRQRVFGYTFEDLRVLIGPMASNAVEPVGSMGKDTPIAILSSKPRLLYEYFKQLFAQVTNPPIDSIREELITATEMTLGPEPNILNPGPENCRKIKLDSPVLTNEDLQKIKNLDNENFKSATLPILFRISDGSKGLEQALDELFENADKAISQGANILILSDRGFNRENAPIPALLASAGLHHHLIRNGNRMKVGLVLESGEPREVHHFALLIGYGISAINPYLAYETILDMINEGMLAGIDKKKAVINYNKSVVKGVVKTMSKIGISAIQSYHGAQIFEAIGLNHDFVDKYFTWTPTRIKGAGIDVIAEEIRLRHETAFPGRDVVPETLDEGGLYQWRPGGEHHAFNPKSVHMLQRACRANSFEQFKNFSDLVNDESKQLATLRGLLELKKDSEPIAIEEVESVESICKRFKTGAMSYGAISQEAHESLAIAMNRIGGKSNTGEGGEDRARNIPDPNGDSRRSSIKQVASGRFGVTSEYLVNAEEIQIKIAQGAKPGEGGQLPGKKVYPWIAKVRLSTPGVGLISPPPHHDIYSIEDLAELIHDLKNANQKARINVKLVSEVGVGTIAAGVAKGHADVILISGYDGGTGASPQSSIQHAGLPWELGLAETHQTLLINNLRSRVVLETDGQMKTGRDVVVAALLGAEEYGFSTAPLIILGCIMMRVCHLDTCPVGVATQNPELREKFAGDPGHVVNFMHFIAEEVREIMAELGFRTINEMIGRTDKLEMRKVVDHWKGKNLDLSDVIYQPDVPSSYGRYCQIEQDHGLDEALDNKVLLNICKPTLEKGEPVEAIIPIKNINRTVGTILGSELTKKYGLDGLPEETVRLHFKGSAGQSFGAFIPKFMTLTLEGDSNDYIGKGLSGGKIIVYPPKGSTFIPEENIIIGNVAFYGATGGESYIRGVAGERFCVRNSGVRAVVEGVGDHACEYMTGGRVVVLGSTGRNFAAGMSGGLAYVLDEEGDFSIHCNQEMVDLEPLNSNDTEEVKEMIERHIEYTGSDKGKRVLANWGSLVDKFVRVIPKDYKRMLQAMERVQEKGLSGDEALMAAFEENKKDLARVSGN
jgi:glutamate synthase domain-containing protein 2/glutamate synthase domain-containing protein 1/glutamate synthase domain-containing protein 3